MKSYTSDPSCLSRINHLLNSEKHLDRIIGALCTLDMDCFDSMIEDMQRCNNVSKHEFYCQLTRFFDSTKKDGDRFFRVYSAQCENASCNKCGIRFFVFVADFTNNYIGIKFYLEGDKVTSFAECGSIRCPVAMKSESKKLFFSVNPF